MTIFSLQASCLALFFAFANAVFSAWLIFPSTKRKQSDWFLITETWPPWYEKAVLPGSSTGDEAHDRIPRQDKKTRASLRWSMLNLLSPQIRCPYPRDCLQIAGLISLDTRPPKCQGNRGCSADPCFLCALRQISQSVRRTLASCAIQSNRASL